MYAKRQKQKTYISTGLRQREEAKERVEEVLNATEIKKAAPDIFFGGRDNINLKPETGTRCLFINRCKKIRSSKVSSLCSASLSNSLSAAFERKSSFKNSVNFCLSVSIIYLMAIFFAHRLKYF
ncbi:MAG: hypothetical protein ACLTS6_09230 [Anaerobutyricum sp.]